jgi:hypothetical protein
MVPKIASRDRSLRLHYCAHPAFALGSACPNPGMSLAPETKLQSKPKQRKKTHQTSVAAAATPTQTGQALTFVEKGPAASKHAVAVKAQPSKKRKRADPITEHPFPTDYCDHFETPLRAYQDIEAVLAALAKKLSKSRAQLRIWDPYFCEGAVTQHLKALGYSSVHHENADFYAVIKAEQQPQYDVLLTNPPYSGDHKQKCLEYCVSSGKPWLLLIPNYIANKDYYRRIALSSSSHPFYVIPRERYEFDHPEGTGHETSPFEGMWYIHCGEHTDAVYAEVARTCSDSNSSSSSSTRVVRTVQGLTEHALVPTAKRRNPRQRKAAKRRLAS